MKKKILMTAIALAGLSTNAHATNGYFTHGLGVINKSMAGAGTADPQEAMAIANNPASALLLKDSTQVGAAIFSPRRSYSASQSLANGNGGAFSLGAGKVASESNYFPIPYVAKTWHLDDNRAMGLTAYGRGGMNTDYKGGNASFDPDGPGPAGVMTLPGTFGAGPAGVDLIQLFVEGAYAWRATEDLVLGVSGILAVQGFEGRGLAAFAPYTKTFAASGGTVMPETLTNNDHDYAYGFGVKAGVHWQASDALRLSLSYQSDIYMGEFDDYSSLFAEQGDFDIPSNIRLGLSYQASDRLDLHVDVDHINFRDVGSVGNRMAPLFSCPTAGAGGSDIEACLGGSRGAGFGWNDVTVYKFGLSWLADNPAWTWRAGMSLNDQPVESPEVLFNILAPGVIERHFTVGATHRLESGREYSFAVMYAPSHKVSGASPFDPTQTIELEMHQFELEFGYSW